MSERGWSGLSDATLVRLAREGDARAFGALYERYVETIYRYVRSRVSGRQEAEDLTETVFLRALEYLDRYEERGWPFSAFLYRIARNLLTDRYRKAGEEVSLDAVGAQAQEADSPEDQVLAAEEVETVRRALLTLPADYQEVIRLRILLSLDTAETAAWMGRSEGAVRVLLYRALKALRERIEHEDADERG